MNKNKSRKIIGATSEKFIYNFRPNSKSGNGNKSCSFSGNKFWHTSCSIICLSKIEEFYKSKSGKDSLNSSSSGS